MLVNDVMKHELNEKDKCVKELRIDIEMMCEECDKLQ